MTLDHQILNQTIKRSHLSTQGSALVVQHALPSPESDPGVTGNPLTTLLTLRKEDDNVEWHELEIQARAHGLPSLASLGTTDMGAHANKQTPLEQNSVDYCQQSTQLQGLSPEFCDQALSFSDPLSHFTDLSFSAASKEEQRLDDMLLDTLSPFGTDPLLSATSPEVSKESSRRSSLSSDDGDEL
ncbi:Transcription factor EC [Myotis davidii]|uniref:Transcription factor EC n=1 Tax=Myotis davidii TaxID=225400 RepID=L5M6D9_MYODS|nr:Transcription factor EC [Myotis davidii]